MTERRACAPGGSGAAAGCAPAGAPTGGNVPLAGQAGEAAARGNVPMAGAPVLRVEEGSPAYCAGFEPGCRVTHVDGRPVRDVIDWMWLSAEDAIEVGYVDNDGDSGVALLEREEGEGWGFEFDGVVFDGTKTCRNACTFCFMRQLPKGMRRSLGMRDDDFRLSFLTGTFVTLTNLSAGDVERIAAQRISPLRVSLHAVDPEVRSSLIGRNAPAGIENLQALLDAGIEFDAQVVLVPGVNDGAVLDETLEWAYARPGIKTVGVVPLGFTRHQGLFSKSFDDSGDSLRVIGQMSRMQGRAMAERGHPWAYAADEFYRNAYGERLLEELPDAGFYGDFSMFEDGIGIIRSTVDSFREAVREGVAERCARSLREAGACARYICGEAMDPYVSQLYADSALDGRLRALVVPNGFFGGNVNVTGLLCGCDIAEAIRADWLSPREGADGVPAYFVPSVVFNSDGVTLDDWTLDDIGRHVGPEIAPRVFRVPSNPIDYMEEIAEISEELQRT